MGVLVLTAVLLAFTATATVNGGISGYATCYYSNMNFYIDGQPVSGLRYYRTWYNADRITLPDNACVLGIQCYSYYFSVGIRAYFNDEYQTDQTWKCSRHAYSGWTGLNYDDSHWETPRITSIGGVRNIPSSALWIRPRYISYFSNIYCRKDFCADTYDCDKKNPCKQNGPQYFPNHDKTMFVQCGVDTCNVMECSEGLVWDQAITGCNRP